MNDFKELIKIYFENNYIKTGNKEDYITVRNFHYGFGKHCSIKSIVLCLADLGIIEKIERKYMPPTYTSIVYINNKYTRVFLGIKESETRRLENEWYARLGGLLQD